MTEAPDRLEDHEQLTQYGTLSGGFHRMPRPSDQNSLSLLAGWWSLEQATKQVRKTDVAPDDAVRYCTAGALRLQGFEPKRTPTRRNPEHVSVELQEGSIWNETNCNAFDACFPATEDRPREDTRNE